MKRRIVFAAPFVVVTASCERPVESHHHHTHARVHVDAGEDAAALPSELVDALPPLHPPPQEDLCDGNFHKQVVYCNPPPRGWRPPPPNEVRVVTAEVSAMVREGTGARVRFQVSDTRVDETWTAKFMLWPDEALVGGTCEIVDHDGRNVECVTARDPAQLVSYGRTLDLEVTPPDSLVAKIKDIREHWDPEPYDPDRGRHSPPEPAPKPVYAQITKVETIGDEAILTIATGTEAGPTRQWNAELVDSNDKPIAGGVLLVIRVAKDHLVCKTKLPASAIKSTLRVRVSPPP